MSLRSATILTALTMFAAGCVGTAQEPASAEPTHHTIRMLAVEWKGGTNIAKEPYPGSDAMPDGQGYGMTPPDDTGRWQVNAYRWDPGTIVVSSGDTVTLDIFGVNGALHESEIEGHNVTFNVTRGTFTNVTFQAGAAGTYRILCHTHAPAMETQLIVLPARSG